MVLSWKGKRSKARKEMERDRATFPSSSASSSSSSRRKKKGGGNGHHKDENLMNTSSRHHLRPPPSTTHRHHPRHKKHPQVLQCIDDDGMMDWWLYEIRHAMCVSLLGGCLLSLFNTQVTPSPPSPPPSGHTSYSWLGRQPATSSSVNIPIGHTTYSWLGKHSPPPPPLHHSRPLTSTSTKQHKANPPTTLR